MSARINVITSNKEYPKNCRKVFYYKKKAAKNFKLLLKGEKISFMSLNRSSREETKKME
jgi:hypothetical protein